VFGPCLRTLDWKVYRAWCVKDACVNPVSRSVCTMISALAFSCAIRGVHVDWMSDDQLADFCRGFLSSCSPFLLLCCRSSQMCTCFGNKTARNSPLISASLVTHSLLHFHLSHMAVHHLRHLHYHRFHILLLAQYFILNSRPGSSANPFLHRPFHFLPD